MSLVESGSAQLEAARTFLTAPDLLNYWLTGEKVSEYTNASTTQMLDARSRDWATELLAKLDIPTHMLPDVVEPGTRLGAYQGIPVIAPACHDTGSAVAATPAESADFGYISSGTWSLAGLETKEPFLGPDALAANVTNEGGVNGHFRLLRNVTGLWLVQQCRATWRKAGRDYSYGQLVELAEAAPALRSFVNPNRAEFLVPGDYPVLVRDMCAESGQPVPEDEGAVVRVILESLAMEYRVIFDQLAGLTGNEMEVIHIFGGGSRNDLLNQMTANVTGRPVVAGPVEATVLGNALVQLISIGELSSLREARQIVARSGQLKRFEPRDVGLWGDAFERYSEG
jgi:rhamnulokinase